MMDKMNKTVLYVDDEEQNLSGFNVVFSDSYKIFTARSAREALDVLKKNEVQVVISDQRMPEMTGLEFLSIVNTEYPHIICIILTAFADSEALIKAVNQGGVYRFLIKPWDEFELNLTIKRALERYHLQFENKKLLSNLTEKNDELVASNRELTAAKEALIENEKLLKKQNEEYLALNEELKENIEQLAILKEKAEESDRLKTSFLHNISHEIRNPMNAIMGFAGFLKNPDLDSKTLNEYADIIVNSGKQLLGIIDDVLTFSLIESRKEKVNYSDVDLIELLKELKIIFNVIAVHKGLELRVKTPEENVHLFINTDRTKLQQILTNLLNNAVKFTDKGFVEVGYKVNDGCILFYVKDTGIGISPDNFEIIFDRFRQAPHFPAVIYSGTGLGLSISKAHVNLLNGKIWVESVPGKGSTFFFTIPEKPVA
jgi:signal transduction histidine kinase